jgi:hypothetical protein
MEPEQLVMPGVTLPPDAEPTHRSIAPRTGADRDEIEVDGVTIAADRYYTDPAVALACVLALGLYHVAPVAPVVLDPHVGGGDLIRAVRALVHSPHCIGLDIDPDAPGRADCDEHEVADWRTYALDRDVDAIVANPPFHGFDDHLSLIIDAVTSGRAQVAGVLLPESALSAPRFADVTGGDRAPAEVHHIVGRIRFHGPGMVASTERRRIRLRAKLGREPTAAELRSSPPTGHVWVIWRHGHAGPCVTRWLRLPVEDRR